jgi:hypothetical protein
VAINNITIAVIVIIKVASKVVSERMPPKTVLVSFPPSRTAPKKIPKKTILVARENLTKPAHTEAPKMIGALLALIII